VADEVSEGNGPVCDYSNVGFVLHKLTKGIMRRDAMLAQKHGITMRNWPKNEAKAKKAAKVPLRKRQKREVRQGETAELEGWTPFAWKHNALRHSFIRTRRAGSGRGEGSGGGHSPRVVFSNYREPVRTADAENGFAITQRLLEQQKADRTAATRPANVLIGGCLTARFSSVLLA